MNGNENTMYQNIQDVNTTRLRKEERLKITYLNVKLNKLTENMKKEYMEKNT